MSLLIVTDKFRFRKEEVSGGISYRFVGLYSNIIAFWERRDPKALLGWYVHGEEQSLRYIKGGRVSQQKRMGIARAIIGFLVKSWRRGEHPVLLLAYPYGVPPVKKFLSWGWVFALVTLFARLGWLTWVVDNSDPPEIVERFRAEKYPRHKSIYRYLLGYFLFPSALYLTVSQGFLRHGIQRYKLHPQRTWLVPNGLLSSIETPVNHTSRGSQVVYGGTISLQMGVGELIETFSRINQKRLVQLFLFGGQLMDVPDYPWLTCKAVPRKVYVEEGLLWADVAVIPYPRNPLTCGTLIAKIFDYMEAGLPVVMFNLGDTAALVKEAGCGLIARDWDEFGSYVLRLLDDPALRRKLGEAGRRAVKEYRYDSIASRFVARLHSALKEVNVRL